MFGFGVSMPSFVTEGIGQPTFTGQRVRILRTEHAFFQGHELTELPFGFPVAPLSPERIGAAIAAAQSVRMLWAKGVATCFDHALQDRGSVAIVPLIDQ